MDRKLDREVRERALYRREYCHLPQSCSRLTFPIDHIIARQHGGPTESQNLALCCGRCNQHKGPNVSGIAPDTGQLTRLFDPRRDVWNEHFQYEGAILRGITDIGRITVMVLNINSSVAVRQTLLDAGSFPEG